MDLNQKIIAGLLLAFFLITLLRVLAEVGFVGRVLLNAFNALVIGILGLPGFVLLLLTQWVL